MPKAELYKISVVEGKVLVRVPPQLVGHRQLPWMTSKPICT